MSIVPVEALPLSADLIANPRSEHAGETGAVMIYRGALAISRNTDVRRFALRHVCAMAAVPALAPLAAKLRAFCDDEIHHKEDAATRLTASSGVVATLSAWIVEAGSPLGVRVARVI